jgi:hypothetical protein
MTGKEIFSVSKFAHLEPASAALRAAKRAVMRGARTCEHASLANLILTMRRS